MYHLNSMTHFESNKNDTFYKMCIYNLCCLIKTDDDELQVLILQADVEDVTMQYQQLSILL